MLHKRIGAEASVQSCKILIVPPERPYPLKETLYSLTSSHLRTPSKKYQYPCLSPKGRIKRKIIQFDAAAEDTHLAPESVKIPRLRKRKGANPQSAQLGFSDMVSYYMDSQASALHKLPLSSTKVWESTTPEVFEHIFNQAKFHMKRRSVLRLSLPDYDTKTVDKRPTPSHTRSSTHRFYNETPLKHTPSLPSKNTAYLTSQTPVSRLSTEKPIRRVENLRKTPFGVHKTYEANFTTKYIRNILTKDWININNSKRTGG